MLFTWCWANKDDDDDDDDDDDVLVGNHLFVIFAVLDVSFAINSCLNRSFFTFICITVLTLDHPAHYSIFVYAFSWTAVLGQYGK